ncbi:MAG: nucleotide excision repair endonuclease [Verrucomicrobiae bacterium]|nr:nucleotide excision repair endonuclease [Verrucomicrobiae bacterium]
MASGQQFLFAPEKPLVQRLGKKFFRKIPRRAGVYKMHDAQGQIVYVGKARDLRQRLRSYRVANPERLGRRHLRLLQSVTRIEFDFCPNEMAALKHEAKLIRELKPKFNRAGVWQGKPQFLTWRFVDQAVELGVQETPLTGWERFGSLGAYAPRLRVVLVRLLWLVANPTRGLHQLPHGWMQNRLPATARLEFGPRLNPVRAALEHAFWGSPTLFLNWLARELNAARPAFERTAIAKDLEELQEFFAQPKQAEQRHGQMALL